MTHDTAEQHAINTIRELFNRPAEPGTHLWQTQADIALALLSVTTTNSNADILDLADKAAQLDQHPQNPRNK